MFVVDADQLPPMRICAGGHADIEHKNAQDIREMAKAHADVTRSHIVVRHVHVSTFQTQIVAISQVEPQRYA